MRDYMLNISHFLTRTARHHSSATATLQGQLTRTYGSLDERVSRLANVLKDMGVGPGDAVGIVTEPEPRALEALFGPLRAGAVLVPMSTKLHGSEYVHMIDRVKMKVLICGSEHVSRISPFLSEAENPVIVLGFDLADMNDSELVDYESALGAANSDCADAEVRGDTPAWIFFTSGTTGRPKGAVLTHRNLHAMVAGQLISICPIKPGDRVAYLTPMAHAAGLLTFQHVARGAVHVFPTTAGFSTEKFYAIVDQCQVNTLFMAPTMVQMLLDDPPGDEFSLSSLRNILYGGAPMYIDRLKEAVERFGKILTNVYALGEAPMSMTCLPAVEHDISSEAAAKRMESVGKECHLVEIRIVDAGGEMLSPGEQGEVIVRGDVVMQGYLNDPEATSAAIRDGWLHTGDVGYLDESGYLFLTDRIKDMIISGGANIYPRELEEILHAHQDVHEACVFGVPDPKWGERVVAAVVPREGSTLSSEEVVEWCRAHLASYKKPSEVYFLATLPKSDTGKILKRTVKSHFLETPRAS
jgi:long-chain acyl-CoA synthetase